MMKVWLYILTLLIGVALGVTGTILAPQFAGRYLPGVFQAKAQVVEGAVEQKLREQDRLLLTVQTFRERFLPRSGKGWRRLISWFKKGTR